MKIERISENQIRCILNQSDLAERNIQLNELAYGSNRAKALFRDMMQQASDDFGFEAENYPLMIEAIPVNKDCLILNVTRVEDPEELDTRFSRFTRSQDAGEDDEYDDEYDSDDDTETDQTTNVLDLIGNLVETIRRAGEAQDFNPLSKTAERVEKEVPDYDTYRIFVFESLDHVIRAAKAVKDIYGGENSLLKNEQDGRYYLILNRSPLTQEEYDSVCNTMIEFSLKLQTTYAMPYHMVEHFKPILTRYAVQDLASL